MKERERILRQLADACDVDGREGVLAAWSLGAAVVKRAVFSPGTVERRLVESRTPTVDLPEPLVHVVQYELERRVERGEWRFPLDLRWKRSCADFPRWGHPPGCALPAMLQYEGLSLELTAPHRYAAGLALEPGHLRASLRLSKTEGMEFVVRLTTESGGQRWRVEQSWDPILLLAQLTASAHGISRRGRRRLFLHRAPKAWRLSLSGTMPRLRIELDAEPWKWEEQRYEIEDSGGEAVRAMGHGPYDLALSAQASLVLVAILDLGSPRDMGGVRIPPPFVTALDVSVFVEELVLRPRTVEADLDDGPFEPLHYPTVTRQDVPSAS